MTARGVFRIVLVLLALGLAARNFGYLGGGSDPSPGTVDRRDPVVVEVPPEAIGAEARPVPRAPGTATPGAANEWGDTPLVIVGSPASSTVRPHDLKRDEARGGHTLARHVAKTSADLRARLAREARIPAASTYTDLGTAQWVVALALDQEARRVSAWAARSGSRPNLALDYDGDPSTVIGRSLARSADAAEKCHDAVVVLRWDTTANDWYVLTSYPEVRRGGR